MGCVISGRGHFGSCSIFDSVRLWVGLLWVFGSKPVAFISDVALGMDSGCSVRVSGLGFVLPGLSVGMHVFGKTHHVKASCRACKSFWGKK